MPSIDVGSIEASLSLNRDEFQAGLDEAQAEGDEFEAQGITVPIKGDTSDFDEKLAQVEAEGDAAGALGGGAGGAGTEGVADTSAIDALDESLVQAAQDADVLGASLSQAGGADAATASQGFEDLDEAIVGTATAAQAGHLGLSDLGLAAADSESSVGDLEAGVEDFNRGLQTAGPGAGAVATQFDALGAGAEAAGVSTADFSGMLSRAGISFNDIADEAERAGVSTTDFAGALGAASAAGSSLAPFWDAIQQGDVSWNHYVNDVVYGSGGVTSALRSTGQAGIDLASAESSVQIYSDQAAMGLARLGLVTSDGGGLFRDLQGNLLTADQALKTFGITTAGGVTTVGDLNTQLTAFAEGGLVDLAGGVDHATLLIGAQATAEQAAAQASKAFESGMADAAVALDDVAVSGVAADAAFDSIIEGTMALDPELVQATGFLQTLLLSLSAIGSGNFGAGITGIGQAFEGVSGNVSTLIQWLLALSPVIAATITAGVGAFMALAGAASIGVAGIGVFALAAIGDLSQFEAAAKSAYDAWDELVTGTQAFQQALAGFGPMITAVLGAITPLVNAAAAAFGQLEQMIIQATKQADFQQFIAWLGSAFGPTVETFITTMENFAAALSKMLEGAWPFIQMIEDGMVSLSQDLEKFAESNGFQTFINWLITNGPNVAGLITNLVGIIEELWKAFSEVGGYLLPVIDDFTKLVAIVMSIPGVGPIVAIGLALVGLAAPIAAGVAGVAVLAAAFGALDIAIVPAIAAVGAVVAPIALAVAAAAALAAAAYEIVTHWSDVAGFFDDLGHDIASWASDLGQSFDQAGSDIASWASDAGQAMDQFGADLDQWGADAVHDLVSGISSAWGSVTSFFSTGLADIVSFFEQLPAKLVQIGDDIVMGLWDGLEEGWDKLFGWLEDAANGIISIFKDVLSIFSPSAVMQQIGEQTMEGLGLGLQAGYLAHVLPTVTDAATGLLGLGVNVAGASVSSLATLGASAIAADLGGANGATPTTLHVEFGPLTISGTTSNEETAALVQAAQDRFARQLTTVVNIRSRGHS